MKTLPRRAFLLNALAACGAPFLPGVGVAARQQSSAQTELTRGTQTAVSYFGAAETTREIGEAYLEHLHAEREPEAIRAAASGALALIAAAKTRQMALTSLVRAVRADFREGRTVELQGWVLSRTEAELCALALLSPA